MIKVFLCAGTGIQKMIRKGLTQLSFSYLWADNELEARTALEEWRKAVSETDLADMLICDITGEEDGVGALKAVRKKHPHALIIPIADGTILPYTYLTPEIAPFSLIWKPVEEPPLFKTLTDAVLCFHPEEEEESDQYFLVESKQTVHRIPYGRILYFEAREKKIFVRLQNEEISFYDTLGHLEETLQEDFLRCHKSFLVNLKYVAGIDRSSRMLNLTDGSALPVSRGYRSFVMEKLHGIIE